MDRTAWVGAVSALCITAFASPPVSAADGLEPISRAGVLKVCIAEAPPYAMKDAQGRWIGHEIDIATRLASDMALRASFVDKPVDQLIPTLAAGGCDLVAAAMAIEPGRLMKAWFSRPYAESEVNIVIARSAGATTLDDLNKPEITLAVVNGTPATEAAAHGLPNARLQAFADLAQARKALEGGSVAGLIASTPIPVLLVAEAPERFKLVDGPPLRREADGFAVRKGAADLLNFVDGWIEVRQRDGFFERADDYWLGGLEWMKRVHPEAAKTP